MSNALTCVSSTISSEQCYNNGYVGLKPSADNINCPASCTLSDCCDSKSDSKTTNNKTSTCKDTIKDTAGCNNNGYKLYKSDGDSINCTTTCTAADCCDQKINTTTTTTTNTSTTCAGTIVDTDGCVKHGYTTYRSNAHNITCTTVTCTTTCTAAECCIGNGTTTTSSSTTHQQTQPNWNNSCYNGTYSYGQQSCWISQRYVL